MCAGVSFRGRIAHVQARCNACNQGASVEAKHTLQGYDHGEARLPVAVLQKRNEDRVYLGTLSKRLLSESGARARLAQFRAENFRDLFCWALRWHAASRREFLHCLHKL